MGAKAKEMLSPSINEGDIVAFDFMGCRALELHPGKDAELIVAVAGQIYCKLFPEQLESRKLPLPA